MSNSELNVTINNTFNGTNNGDENEFHVDVNIDFVGTVSTKQMKYFAQTIKDMLRVELDSVVLAAAKSHADKQLTVTSWSKDTMGIN